MIAVRALEVLQRAVEEGVEHGWRRAHKHTDTPDEASAREQIASSVVDEICQWFDFDEPIKSVSKENT